MEFPIPQWILVAFGYLLALVMSLRVVMQRREPTATLAWVLGMVLLPYIGVVAYVVFGRRRLVRQVRKRQAQSNLIEPKLEQHLADITNVEHTPLEEMPTREQSVLIQLTSRIGCRRQTRGNRVELLVDADQTYQAMEEAIAEARDHVHFQFYVYNDDDTGRRFRDLLTRKAKEGVAVRVLVDGVGSFGLESFMQPLVAAGGHFASFLPVGKFRRWHPNLRNHRKLVVVDGRVGFTGGVNIGDEYTGRQKRTGAWRDTHLRVEGTATAHLQEIFAEDWHFATGREPSEQGWFPHVSPCGAARVHIVASGPDTDTQPLQRIFFSAVTLAKERVYLTTPYFVPDQAMAVALETAALRGLDVRLLLPHRSDAPLVLYAGRSYYDELLQAGVRIFEYQRGFLHAKTMLVDRQWATVGSANMDVRSFRLNFEVNAMVYGPHLPDQLARVFRRDLRLSREVTLEEVKAKSLTQRAAESFARILSPVL
ncbi:MAG: cardiolipin synthase [Deltaproteobacteria bacterium]|nr:cardiolipin synthase [Deltaproteobacteria bacterium]